MSSGFGSNEGGKMLCGSMSYEKEYFFEISKSTMLPNCPTARISVAKLRSSDGPVRHSNLGPYTLEILAQIKPATISDLPHQTSK
jgi:hypothetical protein